MRLLVAICCVLRFSAAQGGEADLRFEVASFKRLRPDAPRHALVREITPTSVTLRNATLGNCLEWAYGYQHFEVSGPDWRDRPTDVVYDIVAKSSGPVPESQLKSMLQTLLKERLGSFAHRELRDLPVYALRLARNGPKFQKSTSQGDPSMKSAGSYSMRYERVTMEQFAKVMDPPVSSRHVVDETGLAGTFDFVVNLSPYVLDPATGKPVVDAIGRIDEESAYTRALPEQLGLRLERKTAPLKVLMIDRVEKDPIGN